MSTTMLRRIEELERREEWHREFGKIERMFAWAVATGQCSEAEGAIHLSEMKRMVPLELFIAGKWTPQIVTPEQEAQTAAMMDAFHAWEHAQGIAS